MNELEKCPTGVKILLAYIIAILCMVIGVINAGHNVKEYREEIAAKYNVTCAWYEKPIFYNKSERMYFNDYTGYFIVEHNQFDIFDQWSGERHYITRNEMAHFEKLQDKYSNRKFWLLVVIFAPWAILFFVFVFSHEHQE